MRFYSTLIITCLLLLQYSNSEGQGWTDTVKIQNPKLLNVETIPAQRIALGVPDDYKPCIARLPNGELLIAAFHSHELDGKRKVGDEELQILREDILLFRSQDGGITWSGPEVLPIIGREAYFTILSDGVILVTVTLLPQEVRNELGFNRAFVHQSTDGGKTWQSTEFGSDMFPGWKPGWPICTSRNILELKDGSLILGAGTKAGNDYLFRSYDRGATWKQTNHCKFELFETQDEQKKLQYPLWGEAVFWQVANGDLLALCRVAPKVVPPLPGVEGVDGHWDHLDRLVLYRSKDSGKYWSYAELGSTYGEMYPAILKLQDGRFLLTFTVRDLHPPLGVRAVLGQETADGIKFDFEHDRIMLDTKTPVSKPSGGGFGRTVQLQDGTLVTCYSYRGQDDKTHLEVVRWKLPKSNKFSVKTTNPDSAYPHETRPIGKTREDQQRNAVLLSGYEYDKYAEALTGYTGQDLQRIGFIRWEHAIRTRVGPRGNYKSGFTRLPNGKLILAVCRDNNETDPAKRRFLISIYESSDVGLTWKKINRTPLFGKEPSLAALPNGTLVMIAQGGYFGPGAKFDEQPLARSEDGGCTWEVSIHKGEDYPRNFIVEPDGSLLMITAVKPDWKNKGNGSPNLLLSRSTDSGKTWTFSEGIVDWDWTAFGEVASIRLKDGRLLAALRRQIPGTKGEGFEDTVLTESLDDGKTWAKPWQLTTTAQVHAYLTELHDGRLLCTYSNYHVPFGVSAILSTDGGKTWDLDKTILLSISNGFWVGWAVTLELPDHSLITSYATTSYRMQPPDMFTSEVVRWKFPD